MADEQVTTRILQDGTEVPDDRFTITRDPDTGNVSMGGEIIVFNRDRNELLDAPAPATDDSIEIDGERFSREELAGRLKKAKELEAQEELIGPVAQLAQTPWFRELHEEAIRSGLIEAPAPPPSDPADVAAHNKRKAEPEFPVVQGWMREYAATLPEHEAELLASSHGRFNEIYDKLKASYGGPIPVPKPEVTPITDIVARLRAKEVSKSQAFTERPGAENPDADAGKNTARAKQVAKLEKAARSGDREAVADLVAFTVFGGGQ